MRAGQPARLVASVLQSSTETTFLHHRGVFRRGRGIKRTRHTLAASAMGDLSASCFPRWRCGYCCCEFPEMIIDEQMKE